MLFPHKKMKQMIEDFAPDGIHIAVEGPLGWAARRYCLKAGKPFTTSFHTHFPDYIRARAPGFLKELCYNLAVTILRRFHAPAKTVFVATQSLEDDLVGWGFQNTMVRLTRGVDLSVFYPPAEKPTHDKPALLYVGRLSVEKNIEAFLDLEIDSHKIVVGRGPTLESLKTRYSHVEFAGLKQGEDLAEYYRKANCFVFPSKSDTFGIVIIEALACGVPVAGYPVTGPRDILTDPILGAVHDSLAIAVQKALASRGSAQDRHDYIKRHYSWGQVAQVFLAEFQSDSIN